MKLLLNFALAGAISFILTSLLILLLRRYASLLTLVDKPNQRKVHQGNIPLVGGIAFALGSIFSLLFMEGGLLLIKENIPVFTSGLLLLLMGVVDDKLNLKAVYKLAIELLLAYFLVDSGFRIYSLAGLFGIHSIPLWTQYVLSIIVIAGVINSFNLMDGADGLAGGLAMLSILSYAVVSYVQLNYLWAGYYFSLFISLGAFLYFNFNKNKVFMGDGGSLFLGVILVTGGLQILKPGVPREMLPEEKTLLLVFGVFLIPVFDSLRVYRARLKKGKSPFKPDKSHLHHLVLLLGWKHAKVSAFICTLSILLILLLQTGGIFVSIGVSASAAVLIYLSGTWVLNLHAKLIYWKEQIVKLEKSKL